MLERWRIEVLELSQKRGAMLLLYRPRLMLFERRGWCKELYKSIRPSYVLVVRLRTLSLSR